MQRAVTGDTRGGKTAVLACIVSIGKVSKRKRKNNNTVRAAVTRQCKG